MSCIHFEHSSINPFNIYVLSPCWVPETMADLRDTSNSYIYKDFPGGSEVKSPPANEGDLGSIPGSRRFPGEWNGNPL